MTHELCDPLSSPSDQSRRRVLNQPSLRARRAAAPQHRQLVWLCASGFALSGAKQQPKSPFSLAFVSGGQEQPAAVGTVRGRALPCHFSDDSLSLPSPYQLTQHLHLSAKQKKCRSIRGRKKKKSQTPRHVCLESQLAKSCLP